jgi:regulator of cell morphogenesis and NO signaling
MTIDKSQTVREIAIAHPATVRVFESFGIDYCCGGRRPLHEACAAAKAPFDRVIEAIDELDENTVSSGEDWANSALAELTAHIVRQHHAYVRDESPRIEALLQKVVNRHGEAHPELGAIQDAFVALSEELFAHMMKEERVLFPFLEEMEGAARAGAPLPFAPFASVELPISRMLADHDDAGALLAKMRELSGGYRPPDGACPSFRGLYKALEEFERDLHHHVHLENNILFPRAAEMEMSLKETAGVHH